MFKRDPVGNILDATGPEYYNSSIPFEGIYINYAKEIMEVSACLLFGVLFRRAICCI
jgi:hypothetical protein